MRILFIVPYAPTAVRTRPVNLMRALAAEGHRVSLATLWSSKAEPELILPLKQHLDTVIGEKISRARLAWSCLGALPTPRPIQASYSWSPALARRITQLLERESFDVIHVEHLRGVRYGLLARSILTDRSRPRPVIVWDSVDCISMLFRRAAREASSLFKRIALKFELPRTEFFEGWLVDRFDRVLVTSAEDKSELLKLVKRNGAGGEGSSASPDGRIDVVPNGVDLDYFTPSEEPRDPRTIVFAGKMSYHANVTAAVRFVEEIMPQVWRELPDTRLCIVGKDPPREVKRLASGVESRIHVTGTVADIRPYLRKASVSVAPIRYGAGIQNKVLEAMACGAPVVATPRAVGALDARWGQDLEVAGDARAFAAATLSLLGDRQRQAELGRNGRLFVERQHDWRTAARRLVDTYIDARN